MNDEGCHLPTLDREQLEDVLQGDVEMARDLLALYRTHESEDLAELLEACGGDCARPRIRTLAHGLRGASATLGLSRAAEAFEWIEESAEDAPSEELARLAGQAHSRYVEACAALEQEVLRLAGRRVG